MNRVIGLLAILVLLSGFAMTEQSSALEPEPPTTAPSCNTVILELTPCAGFIKGGNANPSAGCCSGVKRIGDEAKSAEDRKAICECIKKGLANVGSYDKNRIPQLPNKCGVSIILPAIDSSTDCSKV